MLPHYVLQLLFIEPYLKAAIFCMFTSSYEPTENHHLDLQLHLLGRIASTFNVRFIPTNLVCCFSDTANPMTTR